MYAKMETQIIHMQPEFFDVNVPTYLLTKAKKIINQLGFPSSKFSLSSYNASIVELKGEYHQDARLFNLLVGRMSQPTAGILVSWFSTLLGFIDATWQISKEEVISILGLFSQFADVCLQYQVQNYLTKPDRSCLLTKDSAEIYLKLCIAALEGSKNKSIQARLLDQLPDLSLIKAAYAHGFPFICAKMICYNALQLACNGLENVTDYENNKSNVLSYVAIKPLDFLYSEKLPDFSKTAIIKEIINSRLDFWSCLKFIHALDGLSSERVSPLKKRTLLYRFTRFICQFSAARTIEEVVEIANKLKEINETDYYKKFFGNSATNLSEKQVGSYIQLSKYLMHAKTYSK